MEPPILQLIGELAGVCLRGRILHAGLEHTYGYLFSLIETPFGYKRDRWVRPDLDRGMRINVPTLRDRPVAGTLLFNLTYFLGRIAFRDQRKLLERLHAREAAIAPAAREYPFDELEIQRVVEQAAIPSGRRQGTQIEIHTDFVRMLSPPRRSLRCQHAVGVLHREWPRVGPQLITTFPVTSEFVNEVTSPENQGDAWKSARGTMLTWKASRASVVKGRRFVLE